MAHDPKRYGQQWAADYDQTDGQGDLDTAAAVKALAKLAGSGQVLELAAGTGRIAIPLAETGLKVTATDASPEMIDQLHANDKQSLVTARVEALPVINGTQTYGLICIVLNSLWALPTAEDQLHCLRNAAAKLKPGGALVVEMFVANPQRWLRPCTVQFGVAKAVQTTDWNPATQRVVHNIHFDEQYDTPYPDRDIELRIVWPNELLLMAQVAGLRADQLWSSWAGETFGADSTNMIAIFRKQ